MSIDEMQAGREMDKLVGETFRLSPDLSWQILNADETASIFSAKSEREAEDYLARQLKNYPDSMFKDYHVGHWKFYKRYSSEMAEAWKLVELMNEAGWNFSLIRKLDGISEVSFWHGVIVRTGCHKTAPLAICRSALKALGVS